MIRRKDSLARMCIVVCVGKSVQASPYGVNKFLTLVKRWGKIFVDIATMKVVIASVEIRPKQFTHVKLIQQF